MQRLSYIPSFYFYDFANAVAKPYTNMDAYRSGLIDESGNLTGNEGSFSQFEYFVYRLKRIFDQLPPGTTKYNLSNLIGVMRVFAEEIEQINVSKEQLHCLIEAHITNITDGKLSYFSLLEEEFSYLSMLEDMSVGAIGGAGSLGTPAEAPEANKGGVSGYDPRMGDMFRRDVPVNMVSAVEMFSIPSEEFKAMKASKTYAKTSTGNYLRRFGHRNPEKKVGIRDEETGEIYWLPKANKKTFVEQYGLQNLNLLKESSSMDDAYAALLRAFNDARRTDNDGDKSRGRDGERQAQLVALVHNHSNAMDMGDARVIDQVAQRAIGDAGKPISTNGRDTDLLLPDGSFQGVDAKQTNSDRGPSVGQSSPTESLYSSMSSYQDMIGAMKKGMPLKALKTINRNLRKDLESIAPGLKTEPDPKKLTDQQRQNQEVIKGDIYGSIKTPWAFVKTPSSGKRYKWDTTGPIWVPEKIIKDTVGQKRVSLSSQVYERKENKKPRLEVKARTQSMSSDGSVAGMRQMAGLEPGQPIPSWTSRFRDVGTDGKSDGEQIFDLKVGQEQFDKILPTLSPALQKLLLQAFS